MPKFSMTVLFRERRDYDRLKIAAIVNSVSINELLDQMVEQELKRFTKQEAKGTLPNTTRGKRLLAAW